MKCRICRTIPDAAMDKWKTCPKCVEVEQVIAGLNPSAIKFFHSKLWRMVAGLRRAEGLCNQNPR